MRNQLRAAQRDVPMIVVALSLALATAAIDANAAAAAGPVPEGGKLGARLAGALAAAVAPPPPTAASAEPTWVVWVRFTDKGVTEGAREAALDRAAAALPDKVRDRRDRRGQGPALVDDADLPLATAYMDAVAATGMRPRRQSRWLNAASWEATRAQIAAAAQLPCVAGIDLVRRSGRAAKADLMPATGLQRSTDKSGAGYNYGPGAAQLEAINLPAAHARGLTGAGVTVAIFDTGFDVAHAAVAAADVVATWNFINETPNVGRLDGEDRFQIVHGTAVFSLLAAQSPGIMYGAAPGAAYILAKTEDLSSETPAEEDNWIAALEWAEGLGADVVSSSVGYYYWYDFSECDGVTALITQAAELAAARGVCVVNNVGNERQNPAWPHLIPPADGRHVIAVGSSSTEGLLTSFSSPGPTADGRHKPDVMALGEKLLAALGGTDDLYGYGQGGDYGVAVVSGAVALMLERNPGRSPGQVMAALHATGARAAAPDNDYGWGQADADAAIEYGRPAITHTPLGDREAAVAGGYEVLANITAGAGLAPGGCFVSWRRDTGAWQLLPLAAQGGGGFRALVPAQTGSGVIEYYLVAEDTAGLTAVEPLGGAGAPHAFRFGADTQPPLITHTAPPDQVPANWPPLLVVRATDNLGVAAVTVAVTVNGVAAGTSALVAVGDHWELPFPVDAGNAPVGTTLDYRFTATDLAAGPNTAQSTAFTFRVVADRGNVLLVDDRALSAKDGAAGDGATPSRRQEAPMAADKSITDIAGWLTDAGFAVQTISAGSVQAADLLGRDLVFVTSGLNWSPLANAELRDGLVDYALAGGRVLIEGGEVGYACIGEAATYPALAQSVLHADAWLGEEGPTLWPSVEQAGHPFLHRPNALAGGLPVADTGLWYGAADIMRAAADGLAIMYPPVSAGAGGVIVHDDNSCPEAGQTVYFAFDLGRLSAADGRALVENAATWLTYREPAGSSSIIGRVFLQGSMDFSQLTVQTSRGQAGVIKPNGTYKISGLWDGTHSVTASAPGYGPVTLATNLTVGQQVALNFTLQPVVTVSGAAAPNLAIPDNNATGIASVIHIGSGEQVYGLEVDVDIAHFSVGQLVVTLVDPLGFEVTLHNRTGGVGDDIIGTWPTTIYVDGPGDLATFTGHDPRGDWTLRVSDNLFGATGRLRSWGLRLLVGGEAVAAAPGEVPAAARLVGNAPNPFNPRTVIAFELGAPGDVRLEVFDARGRLVRSLADRTLEAGRHELAWDGLDDGGARAASGVYFARLDAGSSHDVLKMMLLK